MLNYGFKDSTFAPRNKDVVFPLKDSYPALCFLS